MSEVIDKMAQAFAADIQRQSDEGKPGPYIDTDYGMNDVVIDGRVDLVAAIRASLAAARQPTEAMIEAGMKEAAVDLASEYRAMIDTALQEDKG